MLFWKVEMRPAGRGNEEPDRFEAGDPWKQTALKYVKTWMTTAIIAWAVGKRPSSSGIFTIVRNASTNGRSCGCRRKTMLAVFSLLSGRVVASVEEDPGIG